MDDKDKRKRKRLWQGGRLLLAAFYIGFLSIDLFLPAYFWLSNDLKWLSILLLFFLQLFSKGENMPYWTAGAGLTALADFFLLFTGYYSLGVAVFCLAHYCRLFQLNKKRARMMLALPCLIPVLLPFLPLLFCLSIVYALLLLGNTLAAWESGNRRLFLAFLLFLLCDLSVAMVNLFPQAAASSFFQVSMWLFYLPSQYLLASYLLEENDASSS